MTYLFFDSDSDPEELKEKLEEELDSWADDTDLSDLSHDQVSELLEA